MIFKNIRLIDENFEVRENMYLATEGEFIAYIGAEAPDFPGADSDEEIYDGRNKLLIPGFFDTHSHVPMTLLRGYGEGLPLHRWLNEKVFPFEARLTAEDVYWSTKLGAMELLACGTVSISDMYFFIGDMAVSLDECGMKANICHGISSPDPDVRLSDLQGYRDTVSLCQRVKAGEFTSGGEPASGAGIAIHTHANVDRPRALLSSSRIKVDMGLHAEYTSTEGLVRQIAEAASDLGLTVHVHISETESEHEQCKARHTGRTPVRYFYDCGLFENPVRAAHAVHVEDEDITIMKAHGAFMIHNPSSNLKLASGIAPIAKRLSEGVYIGLGTDGASSNNNLNMMEEMHLGAMLARGASGDPNAVSAADMLKMATYMGALSQGRTDTGLIREGMRADLAVVDIDKPHMQPDFDTLSNLVFSAQASDVVLTMVDGKVVYRDGEFYGIDRERVFYEAGRSFRRILSEL